MRYFFYNFFSCFSLVVFPPLLFLLFKFLFAFCVSIFIFLSVLGSFVRFFLSLLPWVQYYASYCDSPPIVKVYNSLLNNPGLTVSLPFVSKYHANIPRSRIIHRYPQFYFALTVLLDIFLRPICVYFTNVKNQYTKNKIKNKEWGTRRLNQIISVLKAVICTCVDEETDWDKLRTF